MKTQFLLTAVFFFSVIAVPSFAQVKIIFDTDFGGDADDLGALVMLHNFIDKNECELVVIMCWSTEKYAVSAIDALNHYYKHPDIPIGVRKGEYHYNKDCYSKPIADHFYHSLNSESAQDATALYRKILTASEDKSIVIVTVGPLMNIQNLIQSGPDSYSSLTGKELIEKKVKEFSIMGGKFPEGKNEWNFNGNMPGVTKFVLENITTPITFSGFEVGLVIKTAEVFNDIDPNTPLHVGFMHFSEHAQWMKANFKGKILDNSSFDQTAVLYAIRGGVDTYWEKIEGGYCKADDHGGNTWVKGSKTNHSYLKLLWEPEDMARLIESIMLNDF